MNPLFPCDHGAATHSCIMHDPGRGTLCKNAIWLYLLYWFVQLPGPASTPTENLFPHWY